MANPIILKITNDGKNAVLDSEHTGLTLRLSQLAIGSGQYKPTGNETALQGEISRHGIVSGNVEPQSHTLRFSSSITSDSETAVYEIGLMTENNVLFAVASSIDTPLLKVYPDITFVASFGLTLEEFDISKITVVNDPNGALSIVLMQQHLAAPDPHPQYAKKKGVSDLLAVLQQELAELKARPYEGIPIWGVLTTVHHYNNGDEVTADLRYGKWARYAQGKVLAGYSLLATDIAEYKTMGNEFGENTHTLTINEMPSHHHTFTKVALEAASKGYITTGGGSVETDNIASDKTGDSQPHNNLQPAVVTAFWVRMPNDYTAPIFEMFWTTDSDGNNRITSTNEGQELYLWLTAQNLVQRMAISFFIDTQADINLNKKANLSYPAVIGNGKHRLGYLPADSYFVMKDSTVTMGVTTADNTSVSTVLAISNTVANTPVAPSLDPNVINATIIIDFDNQTAISSDNRLYLREFFVAKDGVINQIQFKTEKDFLMSPTYNYAKNEVIYNKPLSDFPKTYQAIKESIFEATGLKPNGDSMVIMLLRESIPDFGALNTSDFDMYLHLHSDDYLQNAPNLGIFLGSVERMPRAGKYTLNLKIGRWTQLDGQSDR